MNSFIMLRRPVFSVARVYHRKYMPQYKNSQEEEEKKLQNEYHFSYFKDDYDEEDEELSYLNYVCKLHANRN